MSKPSAAQIKHRISQKRGDRGNRQRFQFSAACDYGIQSLRRGSRLAWQIKGPQIAISRDLTQKKNCVGAFLFIFPPQRTPPETHINSGKYGIEYWAAAVTLALI
jgi:ribosomal protein L16/L10AE